MRRKLVVGNLKMHGSLVENKQLFEHFANKLNALHHVDIAICVPYPYLFQAQSLLKNTSICWGAQNISKDVIGAFTGEVSASMLNDFSTRYVIVGHSERSTAYCESDINVATKFMMAKNAGITPIFCVGETLIEREAGVMKRVVSDQMETILTTYGAHVFDQAVIAYEPIWAIGTGMAASPDQAQNMHKFIREKIAALDEEAAKSVKILYGGSVNSRNAVQLLAMPDIDGGLIGRSALIAEDFEEICHAAEQQYV